jgi:acyl-coenzyme A thioesterase PaaI-like protein
MFSSTEYAVLAQDKAYFLAVPWLAPHISAAGWIAFPTRSREPKPSTEDAFFAKALRGKDTISHCLSLCQASELPVLASGSRTSLLPIPKAKSLLRLGEQLAGYPRIAHGGLLSALLDEQMGILLTVNHEFATEAGNAEITQMTTGISVRYRRPVELPGVVVVEAEAARREGKRLIIKARLIDEKGVCAEGEGVWVDVPSTRL